MPETRLFDGDRLRASMFNPGQDRLFVSFRQRTQEAGAFSEAAPIKTFVGAGYTHLHLQARLNDWYINSETRALEAELERFSRQFAAVQSIGFSMGGYAALRFAKALNLSQLIAVSPQYSIAPEHVPFDRRYRKFAKEFDPDLGGLMEREHPVQGVVLADPFRSADLVHAQMIDLVFPGMSVARLAASGHPATQVLRQGGKFGALQRLLRTDMVHRSRLCKLHRKSRRGSPVYWRHLAQRAEQSGRQELAARAERRHIQLMKDKAAEKAGG
ncbi:alpha/beta hydrolase [Tropicibacter sp. R16_0]|nr:alpha/beta hydrolase [Tropicibacter sp. R16_0]